ncbi:MAG: hypothetical protein ABIF10_01805, partial [Candidatus Woesearchaeota archaeon]
MSRMALESIIIPRDPVLERELAGHLLETACGIISRKDLLARTSDIRKRLMEKDPKVWDMPTNYLLLDDVLNAVETAEIPHSGA